MAHTCPESKAYTCPEHVLKVWLIPVLNMGSMETLHLKDRDSQKGWLEPQHWPYAMLTPGSVPERKLAASPGGILCNKQHHLNTLAIGTTCT